MVVATGTTRCIRSKKRLHISNTRTSKRGFEIRDGKTPGKNQKIKLVLPFLKFLPIVIISIDSVKDVKNSINKRNFPQILCIANKSVGKDKLANQLS